MDSLTLKFILENENSDVTKLLLSGSRYQGVDIRIAANAIQARKKIKHKIPTWYKHPSLSFPSSLPLEQCSSEATALYKQRFISQDDIVADLTGGLGVDSWAFSKKSRRVDYYERNKELATIVKANFTELNCTNIDLFSIEIETGFLYTLKGKTHYDLIYLDPARRGKRGEKVFTIEDCEPNFLMLRESIFSLSDKVLIKLSPMIDLSFTLKLLPQTSQVHILSVDNECKELLLLLEREHNSSIEPIIEAINISSKGTESHFTFTNSQERGAKANYCATFCQFLYEPNRSILKAGAFKLLSERFQMPQISPDSHLYISDKAIEDFPGKRYQINQICNFNKETIKNISAHYPKASISAKGFPLSSAELQKRLKIADGEKVKIFACTTINGERKLIICQTN